MITLGMARAAFNSAHKPESLKTLESYARKCYVMDTNDEPLRYIIEADNLHEWCEILDATYESKIYTGESKNIGKYQVKVMYGDDKSMGTKVAKAATKASAKKHFLTNVPTKYFKAVFNNIDEFNSYISFLNGVGVYYQSSNTF